MADQLSRPVLATQGRRRLQSLRLHTLLQALLPPTMLGEGWDGGTRYLTRPSPALLVAVACLLSLPPTTYADNIVGKGVAPPKHKWTEFVQVKGQPEPVPAEWVSTPEGQFAHSIEIPNPVPKDSGYRWWWSAKKYFLHLCEKEAGEFVFKTAENVEGFLFMRPPKQPTDFDLKDRYKLEAPQFEARYQVREDSVNGRGTEYASPPFQKFQYYEEPDLAAKGPGSAYITVGQYQDKAPHYRSVQRSNDPTSRYAVTWRGLRRPHDRESGIAGVELLVIDLNSGRAIGAMRSFGLSGRTPGTPDGFWWLNAAICPSFYKLYRRPDLEQNYGFVSKVLVPVAATD